VYSESTNEICITNWINYNLSTSHSVLNCIWKDIQLVKDKSLIKSIYTMDLIKTLESVPMGSIGKGGPYTPLIEYLHFIYTMDTECTHTMDTPKQEEKEEVQAEEQLEEEVQAEEQLEEEVEVEVQSEELEKFDISSELDFFDEVKSIRGY
jgi:hypothetical protein